MNCGLEGGGFGCGVIISGVGELFGMEVRRSRFLCKTRPNGTLHYTLINSVNGILLCQRSKMWVDCLLRSTGHVGSIGHVG